MTSYIEILIDREDGQHELRCAKDFGDALVQITEKIFRATEGEEGITSITFAKKDI